MHRYIQLDKIGKHIVMGVDIYTNKIIVRIKKIKKFDVLAILFGGGVKGIENNMYVLYNYIFIELWVNIYSPSVFDRFQFNVLNKFNNWVK